MSVPQALRRNWSTVAGIKSNCRREPNGCWVWLGGCCDGTPKIRAFDPKVGDKRPMSGPRAMWLAAYGREAYGLAFSACATPKCLNPLHLREAPSQAGMIDYLRRIGRYKGTNLAQRAAAAAKGRAAQGMVDTPTEIVRAIWSSPPEMTHASLARSTGCARKTVALIRRGLAYTHITGGAAPVETPHPLADK